MTMYCYFISVLVLIIPTVISNSNSNINLHGLTADGWEYVKDYLTENIIEERDLGASISIYYEGKVVVDLTAGWFDKTKTVPYDNQTLQLVFSTTKGLTGIAVALCVQRGLLNYSSLVTDYWSEYGQSGKANTTVADILSHRAGLPLDNSSFEQYYNWSSMVHKLEKETPLWAPGTAHGYHPLTFGWLAGELVRRVDHLNRSLGEFIRDEITGPLDIEFYVGLPKENEYRVSPLDFGLNHSSSEQYDAFNQQSTHEAEIPAGNGITNARSVAKLYASLFNDMVDNKYKRLLNEDILKEATKSNTPVNEIDLVLNVTSVFSKGFLLMDQAFPELGPGSFGYSGIGGSIGFAVPEKKLSFAYVMNRIDTAIPVDVDIRYKSLIKEIAKKLNKNNSLSVRLSTSVFVLSIIYSFVSL
ncbi:unnamed protein product [Rotaria socialis]|uniref:Beta-lactamase-related domain-containing protein n=1 Tax=Rotaria socialis TaxID=392032 RepID=A0A818WN28_9BILA|nr:unnamed protein product [Rotaria socialis]